MPVFKLRFARDDPESGALIVRETGRRGWLEVRGRAFSHRGKGEPCPMQQVHDAMTGWHACILHAVDEAVILPRYPDHDGLLRTFESV